MRVGALLLATALAAGCGAATPAAPTASLTGIGGTWSGQAVDASGPGTMTWRITSSGTSFSGTVTAVDASTQMTGRGVLSGTWAGSAVDPSFTFSIAFPEGAFDSPYDRCTATITGTGQVTGAQLSASYAGSNSCSGEVASGRLTLNRP